MRCRRARRLVFEFIDGSIDDAKRLELEKHLSECAGCEKFSSQLTRSMDLVHRARVEAPGDNFAWKVRLRLNQERKAIQKHSVSEGALLRAWNVRYAAAAVGAFAVVVAAGTLALKLGLDTYAPKRATVSLPPVVAVDGRGTNENEPISTTASTPATTAGGQVYNRPGLNWPELGIRVPNRSFVSPVSLGPRSTNAYPGSPGAIDETPTGATLDLDSIIYQQIDKLPPDERVQYIQERIRFLNGHLERYTQNPGR